MDSIACRARGRPSRRRTPLARRSGAWRCTRPRPCATRRAASFTRWVARGVGGPSRGAIGRGSQPPPAAAPPVSLRPRPAGVRTAGPLPSASARHRPATPPLPSASPPLQDLQSGELPSTRIQPDRRWFGNTRVVGQRQLEAFRTEMAGKVSDAYTVLLREKKLPLQLLEDPERKVVGRACVPGGGVRGKGGLSTVVCVRRGRSGGAVSGGLASRGKGRRGGVVIPRGGASGRGTSGPNGGRVRASLWVCAEDRCWGEGAGAPCIPCIHTGELAPRGGPFPTRARVFSPSLRPPPPPPGRSAARRRARACSRPSPSPTPLAPSGAASGRSWLQRGLRGW